MLRDRSPMFFGTNGLRAGWRVLLFLLVAQALGVLLFLIILGPAFRKGLFGWPPTKLLVLWLWFLLPLLGAAAAMARMEGRPMGTFGLPWRQAFGARFWEGALWGLAFQAVLLAALRMAGGFSFGRLVLHGNEIWRWGAGWAVAFVAVGMMLEYLYRGYPLYTLAQGMGFWPAAAVTSLVFALVYLPYGGVNLPLTAGAALVGLFWCLTVQRTGNLWFAVGFHSAWDWTGRFVYDPNHGPGALLSASFHGPAWLSGGRAGPEGSVVVFPLILLMWSAVTLRFPRCLADASGTQKNH